jgi:hypothetical protein
MASDIGYGIAIGYRSSDIAVHVVEAIAHVTGGVLAHGCDLIVCQFGVGPWRAADDERFEVAVELPSVTSAPAATIRVRANRRAVQHEWRPSPRAPGPQMAHRVRGQP